MHFLLKQDIGTRRITIRYSAIYNYYYLSTACLTFANQHSTQSKARKIKSQYVGPEFVCPSPHGDDVLFILRSLQNVKMKKTQRRKLFHNYTVYLYMCFSCKCHYISCVYVGAFEGFEPAKVFSASVETSASPAS